MTSIDRRAFLALLGAGASVSALGWAPEDAARAGPLAATYYYLPG